MDNFHVSDWMQAFRLIIAFIITTILGVHAYYAQQQYDIKAVVPKRIIFLIFSVVFFLASLSTFSQACVTIVFRNYQTLNVRIGYTTLIFMITYIAILAGFSKNKYK
ncbi:MAG: hypothetical protein SNJ70_06095 [Armatimonadota bacterium]